MLYERNVGTMDLADIDAANYAGAIGASAAGRLYALLTDAEKEFDYRWMTADAQLALDDVEAVTKGMADFICRTACDNPETVYRHAVAEDDDGILCLEADWFAEPLARTTAFSLFTSTCLAAFNAIKGEQRAQAAKAVLAAQEPQKLKLKDSIFEPHGSMGEMRPEAMQALQDGAMRDAESEAAADAKSWANDTMSAGVAVLGELRAHDALSTVSDAMDVTADGASGIVSGSEPAQPEAAKPARSRKT